MIRKANEVDTQITNRMKEGKGDIETKRFLKPEEFHNKGRLFGKITLKPGTSIGLHQHVGECETFYILSGEGTVCDNGEMRKIKAGEVMYTDSGEHHSIENTGEIDLELIAMILYV